MEFRWFRHSEFHEGGFKQAIRMGKWKGVKIGTKPLELYNLQEDKGETKNIAEQHANVVKRIENAMKNVRTESPLFPVKKK